MRIPDCVGDRADEQVADADPRELAVRRVHQRGAYPASAPVRIHAERLYYRDSLVGDHVSSPASIRTSTYPIGLFAGLGARVNDPASSSQTSYSARLRRHDSSGSSGPAARGGDTLPWCSSRASQRGLNDLDLPGPRAAGSQPSAFHGGYCHAAKGERRGGCIPAAALPSDHP